ncbi:Protein CBG00056 [Caenorhabditis briggsae]|nr:Protein CBG00056 [Caenorhabditis briggsae]CAP21583.1 Protein CBG00056 [Caenorhabditis briggsae]
MYGKNEQQALRPQFVLFNCTRQPQLVLLGVHRKENRYLKLEFEHPQHQFKVHSCDCQTPTMESDLNPLHTSHCSEIGKIVVDCWNSFNNKREQYVYNKESKILEQVHRSDIMFRPDLNISRHVMICDIGSGVNISIEKDADGLCQFRHEEGQTVKLPDSVVQQFVSDNDVIPEPEQPPENVFQQYFQTLPDFITLFCPCFNRINICVKITDGTYLKYYFNEKRMVRTINCPVCPEKITQNFLVPMYFDCREGQDNVIHCRNKTTNLFEQYIYDWNASELKQVFLPEFPYDGSRRQDSDSYFFKIDDIIISKEGEYLMLEILRSSNKRVRFGPVAVNTMTMQYKIFEENERERKSKEIQNNSSRAEDVEGFSPTFSQELHNRIRGCQSSEFFLDHGNYDKLYEFVENVGKLIAHNNKNRFNTNQ